MSLCEREVCRKPLVKRSDERPSMFAKRRFCSNTCADRHRSESAPLHLCACGCGRTVIRHKDEGSKNYGKRLYATHACRWKRQKEGLDAYLARRAALPPELRPKAGGRPKKVRTPEPPKPEPEKEPRAVSPGRNEYTSLLTAQWTPPPPTDWQTVSAPKYDEGVPVCPLHGERIGTYGCSACAVIARARRTA